MKTSREKNELINVNEENQNLIEDLRRSQNPGTIVWKSSLETTWRYDDIIEDLKIELEGTTKEKNELEQQLKKKNRELELITKTSNEILQEKDQLAIELNETKKQLTEKTKETKKYFPLSSLFSRKNDESKKTAEEEEEKILTIEAENYELKRDLEEKDKELKDYKKKLNEATDLATAKDRENVELQEKLETKDLEKDLLEQEVNWYRSSFPSMSDATNQFSLPPSHRSSFSEKGKKPQPRDGRSLFDTTAQMIESLKNQIKTLEELTNKTPEEEAELTAKKKELKETETFCGSSDFSPNYYFNQERQVDDEADDSLLQSLPLQRTGSNSSFSSRRSSQRLSESFDTIKASYEEEKTKNGELTKKNAKLAEELKEQKEENNKLMNKVLKDSKKLDDSEAALKKSEAVSNIKKKALDRIIKLNSERKRDATKDSETLQGKLSAARQELSELWIEKTAKEIEDINNKAKIIHLENEVKMLSAKLAHHPEIKDDNNSQAEEEGSETASTVVPRNKGKENSETGDDEEYSAEQKSFLAKVSEMIREGSATHGTSWRDFFDETAGQEDLPDCKKLSKSLQEIFLEDQRTKDQILLLEKKLVDQTIVNEAKDSLNNQGEALQTIYEENNNRIEKEKKEKENVPNETRQRKDSLKKDISRFKDARTMNEKAIKDAEGFKQKYGNPEKYDKAIKSKSNENGQIKKIIEFKNKELIEVEKQGQERLESIKKKIESLENEQELIKKCKKNLEIFEKQLDALLASSQELKDRLAILKEEGELDQKVDELIEQLSQNSTEFARQREELIREVEEKTRQGELSEKEKTRLEERVKELQESEAKLANDKKKIEEEIQRLKNINAKQKTNLSDSQNAANSLNKGITKIRSQADQYLENCLRQAKEAAEEKLRVAEQELIAAKREINQLKNVSPPNTPPKNRNKKDEKCKNSQQKNTELEKKNDESSTAEQDDSKEQKEKDKGKTQELSTESEKNSAVVSSGKPEKTKHKNCILYQAERDEWEEKYKNLEQEVRTLRYQKPQTTYLNNTIIKEKIVLENLTESEQKWLETTSWIYKDFATASGTTNNDEEFKKLYTKYLALDANSSTKTELDWGCRVYGKGQ